MYGVFFRTGDLAFVDPEEFAPREAKSWKGNFDATAELATAGAAGGTPLTSWMLARLAALSENSQFPAEFVRRESELGGFRIRLLAVRGTEPLAKLRLAAECGVAELTAAAANVEVAAVAARGLIAALAAEPTNLGRCRVEVRARELGGFHNEYGFDGVGFLGQHNVYE